MISATLLGQNGRLGNLLFQYAAAKSLSLYHNCELKLHPDIFKINHHGQECLFNKSLNQFKSI
jgi:hypothetical protein